MGMDFFQDFGSVYFGFGFLGLHPYDKPIFGILVCFWAFDNASWLAETSSTGHQHNIKLTRANGSSMKQIFL